MVKTGLKILEINDIDIDFYLNDYINGVFDFEEYKNLILNYMNYKSNLVNKEFVLKKKGGFICH